MKISGKLFFISYIFNKIFYLLYLYIYTYFKVIKKAQFYTHTGRWSITQFDKIWIFSFWSVTSHFQ